MDKGRPKPDAWVVRLDELLAALRRCRLHATHWHLADQCPICEIECRTGIEFFSGSSFASDSVYNPEREASVLWATIEAEAAPVARGAEPVPSSFQSSMTPTPYPKLRSRIWVGKLLQNLGLLEPSDRRERSRREAQLMAARKGYVDLAKAWHAHDPVAGFDHLRAELKGVRDQLTSLLAKRHQEIVAAQRWLGLQRFLAAHVIAQAEIKGLGRVLLATLIAHGIETAADVSSTNLDVIPGIGPKRRLALVTWRSNVAKTYRPADAGLTPDAATLLQIDSRHHAEVTRLLETLRTGAVSLRSLSKVEQKKTSDDMGRLLIAARMVAQAELDLCAGIAG